MSKAVKKQRGVYLRGQIYWISYADANGEIQRESTGQKNKEVAVKLLKGRKGITTSAHETVLVSPDALKKQKQPFWVLIDSYDTMVAKGQDGYCTKKYYIQHLKGVFGSTRILDISQEMMEFFRALLLGVVPDHIQPEFKFIVDKRQEHLKKPVYSAVAINRMFSCFKHIMSKGAEWGYGQDLPERFKKIKKLKEVERTDNYSEETCLKLITSAQTRHHRLYVLIGLNTGCRNKEAMHLQWRDIDFKAKTITFRPEITKNKDHRVIPLSAPLLQELQAAWDSMAKKPEPRDWLFADTETGTRIKSFRTAFSTMCRSVGIDCRYHALRHTFASRLASKKIHVKLIAALIGDSVETSMRYVHQDTSHKVAAVEEIGIGCSEAFDLKQVSRADLPDKQQEKSLVAAP